MPLHCASEIHAEEVTIFTTGKYGIIRHNSPGLQFDLGYNAARYLRLVGDFGAQFHSTSIVWTNGKKAEAQKLQAQMEQLQAEAAKKTVEATAGGGMVTVVANGKQEVVSIKIDREVINPEDAQMLEDLVLAATNEALRKSKEMVQGEMSKITAGLKIPGLGM